MFDAIETSSDFQELQGKLDQAELGRASSAVKGFNREITVECQ
jgi:hypothetical protein